MNSRRLIGAKKYSLVKGKCFRRYFVLAIFALLISCRPQTSTGEKPLLNEESNSQDVVVTVFKLPDRGINVDFPNISENEILSIADKALNQRNEEMRPKRIVLCETVLFWQVLYEELGIEYGINKQGGQLVGTTIIPLPQISKSTSKTLSESEALNLAQAETESYLISLGAADEIGSFHAVACELRYSWRVYYVDNDTWNARDWSNLPNSNPPNYLIDKIGGKFLFRSFDARQ